MPKSFSKCTGNDLLRINIFFPICLLLVLSSIYSIFLLAPAYADAAPKYPGITPAPLIDIRGVINVQGPDNTNPVPTVPLKPIYAKSNAVDAAGMDFIDQDTSLNQASIFAAVTIDKPYNHAYEVCNSYGGFTLDEAYTTGIPELVYSSKDVPKFWYFSMSKQKVIEKAFTFVVYVNEAKKMFTVDSIGWAPPSNQLPSHNYIFNFEVWSVSQQHSQNILVNILSKLSSYNGWQIEYLNHKAIKPSILINSANITQMKVLNLLTQAQEAIFTGSFRYPDNKNKSISFSFSQTLDPGINIVNMPFSNILDETVYVKNSSFQDMVYVGTGYWFAFSNPGKTISKTDLQLAETDSDTSAEGDFYLGCSGMKGKVPANGFGGLARTLNPNSIPVDISSYKSLSFWARGDGNSYSVQLETEAVRELNSNDFYQFSITPSNEWKQYVIPLSSFRQLGKDPNKIVAFTGTDVISVAWETASAPLDSVKLEIKNASFIGNTIIILKIGSSKISVNGAEKDLDPGYKTTPVIIDGRTFIPIRAVIESLGGTIGWSSTDQTVTTKLNDKNIVLGIGKTSATVNGTDIALDDAPFISTTGRTMLPLRFIAENFGHSVVWDDGSKTISIQ